MRNAIRRRNHKERSQPLNRQKLGFLEKHKDYVKRARDYHSKQDRLKKLREKAELRNKDEFYFGMVGKKTQKGQHFQDRGNTPLPNDLIRVLKTQDTGYIHMQRAINNKRIDKLKSNLSSLTNIKELADEERRFDLGIDEYQEFALKAASLIPSDEPKNSRRRSRSDWKSHIVFADPNEPNVEDNQDTQEEAADNDEDETVDLGWKESKKDRKRASKAAATVTVEEDKDAIDGNDAFDDEVVGETQLKKTLNELTQRTFRQDALDRAARELELTKALMGKGAKQKLEKGQKTRIEDGEQEDREGKARVFKWRAERKK
ncbi:u3 small nucleolar RNA-associated protein 11 [Wallemia mellicola CBS 633.66]|uniref:U3 small nucleolar RNA-associated protein 11 n=1 Tax=Wallemia mellicola (strain ATCC MYA-4683 / CBS 633.66) TaxID=671144 RepID=I4Y8D3_WALMC|nr:u3 small nucleolar RNA-associated protein 11 [Wallemia mellicola CBS 633.66]EIM20225.1 u3 small nucleolar RNA-associated protein 11 [Wallemia mellicola CBS 633.66]|eukprot:XP_006959713.1 u3 small nucleolar RNA-associated protein 11 [Wallemia mellicola CBS 633.66]